MELFSNTVRQRIYNIVVDDLTNTLRKKEYKVLISEAYPEEGDPKYIIWINEKESTAYRFIWEIGEDYFELGSSHYSKAMQTDRMRWDVIRIYSLNFQDIPEEDIPPITNVFLDPKAQTPSSINTKTAIPGVTGSQFPFQNTITDPEYMEIDDPTHHEETELQSIGKFLSENKVAGFIVTTVLLYLLKQCANS